MKSILLAAGLGTRLRPLTNNMPKCLININGEPLLSLWLSKLKELHVEDFFINTHYLSHEVEKYISKTDFKDNVTLSNEKELLGTAGTLIKNKEFFGGEDGFLIHADNFCNDDLKKMLAVHKNRPENCVMTMLIFETDKPKESGIVCVDENNIIQEFYEKIDNPPSNLANGAIYILSSKFLNEIKDYDYKEIHDFSNQIIPKFLGRIMAYKTTDLFRDIGTLESYNFVNKFLEKKKN